MQGHNSSCAQMNKQKKNNKSKEKKGQAWAWQQCVAWRGLCSTGSCPISKGSPAPYSLCIAWIIVSYAALYGGCTVLSRDYMRLNKGPTKVRRFYPSSMSPPSLEAQSSCFLRKAKASVVIDTWLATFLGRGSLSWRRALCMSHRCLSARYTCTAASSSSPPKPFFSFNQPSRFWPTVPATGVLLQGSIIRQFPGELLMACRGPDK